MEKLVDAILRRAEIVEDEMKKKSCLLGLTVKQIQCIEFIQQLTNPTLTELSESLGITKPSTNAMLNKLETRGFITRVKSDTDRRSAHVHLTNTGIEASELHREVHQKIAAQLVSGLTESERDILKVILSKALLSFS